MVSHIVESSHRPNFRTLFFYNYSAADDNVTPGMAIQTLAEYTLQLFPVVATQDSACPGGSLGAKPLLK